jgi:hypothetical protein
MWIYATIPKWIYVTIPKWIYVTIPKWIYVTIPKWIYVTIPKLNYSTMLYMSIHQPLTTSALCSSMCKKCVLDTDDEIALPR